MKQILKAETPQVVVTMLTGDVIEKYIRAGKIASKVREEMKRMVKEGMALIDVCEKAEKLILDLGGKPAFPCNISINEVAAHYTSPPGDALTIPEKSIVKIDIGVHVDGYIADTATTISFNPDYEILVDAAEAALKHAIDVIRPGLEISRFGYEIQSLIERRGLKPISNLTGHQVGRYLIHAGKVLPNVSQISFSKIKAGEVYAVEPFVTFREAYGRVRDAKSAYIFRLTKMKPPKRRDEEDLFLFIERRFRTLPFAERWLRDYGPREEYSPFFRKLLSSRWIMSYPVLVEASGKPVAQAEHTVIVYEDGVIRIT
ncbi:TPA: type II methionyl aminopeptidase [Candidatus Bathyarchaeota archaeon]|nr:type II methionyl aminopeptidase [Candidatus Bathyarchaeota archaeon]